MNIKQTLHAVIEEAGDSGTDHIELVKLCTVMLTEVERLERRVRRLWSFGCAVSVLVVALAMAWVSK
jgi:hypothetical protein